MSLDAQSKEEIRNFMNSLCKEKERLSINEKELVINEIKDYLNSRDDLQPKEETEVETIIAEASLEITNLRNLTAEIDEKKGRLKNHDWLFDLLKNKNINGLKIIRDKNT